MVAFNPHNSLHHLLYKRFDYAGMFPPAALSFEAALTESARHATTLSYPWMVGTDLVLDTAHTRHLAKHDIRPLGFVNPPTITVLVTEGATAAIEAAKDIAHSNQALCPRVVAFEAKVSPATFSMLVKELGSYARDTGASIAVEPDLSVPDWRETLRETVAAIVKSPLSTQLALKCRCTGPTGINPERMACAIAAAGDVGIGFKVTGGLHHPIVEPQRHEYPMGFLNLACAVYLRRALGENISEQQLSDLLSNSSVKQLSFAHGIRYGSYEISLEQLMHEQKRASFSIGSCSLREPDDDLTRLGFNGAAS